MAYTGSKAQAGRGWSFGIGLAVGTALPTGITGTTTSGTSSITIASSIIGVLVGMGVSGTGIAPGTVVSATPTGTTIPLSLPATASGSTVALTFSLGYTAIGEIKSLTPVDGKFDKEDVSNFQSNLDKEFLKLMRDNGAPKISGNRVSGDAGQLALVAAYNDANNAYAFQVQATLAKGQTTSGDTYTYNALVMGQSFGPIEPNKVVTYSAELQITGPVTFTAGS